MSGRRLNVSGGGFSKLLVAPFVHPVIGAPAVILLYHELSFSPL